MRLLLLLPTTTYRTGAFVTAAKALDVDLTVASERDSAFADREPAGLLTLDFGDPEGAARRVSEYAAHHPIAAVFGVDDDTAFVASVIAQALSLPHNSISTMDAARNKYRQRCLLRDGGVRVPDFARYHIQDPAGPIADATCYPAVLKPTDLAASRGVMRVNDAREFREAHARLSAIIAAAEQERQETRNRPEYLVESYVPGPEFALEGLLVDGELHVLALFDKPDPMEGPFFEETIYTTPSRQPAPVCDALAQCAQAATRAIGLTRGPVHVELRCNDTGPWLIELAARPIGGKCGQVLRFGEDGALSLERVLLTHALNRLSTIPPREPDAAGVMMIPVPARGILRDVRGMAAALATPLVTDLIVTAHRGQRLVPLPEEAKYPGFLFARGDDRREVRTNRDGWYGEPRDHIQHHVDLLLVDEVPGAGYVHDPQGAQPFAKQGEFSRMRFACVSLGAQKENDGDTNVSESLMKRLRLRGFRHRLEDGHRCAQVPYRIDGVTRNDFVDDPARIRRCGSHVASDRLSKELLAEQLDYRCESLELT